MSDELRQPWEKQPQESKAAFDAFEHYRNVGANRSIVGTADALSKSRGTCHDWSQKYGWISRAEAFDQHCAREAANKLVADRIEMNTRHASLAKAMQAKLVARLQSLKPSELTPTQAIQWFNIATQVERQALGGDVQRVELTGKDGGPVETASLTPEERRVRLKEIIGELERRNLLQHASGKAVRASDADPDDTAGDDDDADQR